MDVPFCQNSGGQPGGSTGRPPLFLDFDRSFGQKKGAVSRLPIDSSIFCCKTNTVMTVLIQTSIVYRIFGEEKEVFTTDGCKRNFFCLCGQGTYGK